MKLALIAAALILATTPVYAGKEKCKDVTIKVKNERPDDIKVIDIQYHDSSIQDWRNENGVSSKTALKNGGWINPAYERDLEEVLRDTVKVRVKYKISKLGKWKDATWSDSSTSAVCTEGKIYTVFASPSD